MTIRECYEKIGGDYTEALGRLMNEKMIDRFIRLFLKDRSFASLKSAMLSGEKEEAFRAAHTLKGVCGNLSLTALYEAGSALTEELRKDSDVITDRAEQLFEEVAVQYDRTVTGIEEYIG